ncbi:MAG: hypothetical protein WBO08_03485 [Mycobacterium sp.]|nr:hypothetical protein [Mycobacterium sp.]
MTTENAVTGTSVRRWTAGALAGVAVAAGLGMGLAPVASAEPENSSQEQPVQRVSPDQILMAISEQYQTGSGGGQVSKLIEQVMTLRQRGARPSAANAQALLDGLNRRPNQGPLIEALQATLAHQRQTLARGSSGGDSGQERGRAQPWVPPANDKNPLIPPGWGSGSNPFS